MADMQSGLEINSLLEVAEDEPSKRSIAETLRHWRQTLFYWDKERRNLLWWRLKWYYIDPVKSFPSRVQGRFVLWVVRHYKLHDYYWSANADELRNALNTFTAIEEYTKTNLIRKLATMSLFRRREGHERLYERMIRHEPQWFITLYFDALYEINTIGSENGLSVCQKFTEFYVGEMEKLMNAFIEEMLRYYTYDTPVLDPDAVNVVKSRIEDYSIQEMEQKASYYRTLMHTRGILYAEREASEEPNPFIRRFLSTMIDGYEPEEVEKMARLEIRCKLLQYRQLGELIEVGLVGIFRGDNPRMLEWQLLCYVEENERSAITLFKP